MTARTAGARLSDADGAENCGRPIKEPDETTLSAAVRIAPHPAGGVFPDQGPPGAGKTHTGAHMALRAGPVGKWTTPQLPLHPADGAETATETGSHWCAQEVSEEEDRPQLPVRDG